MIAGRGIEKMPTYEYLCEICGYRFEQFQNMRAQPLQTCPRCGGKIQRLIGAGIGVILKGKGYDKVDDKDSASTGRTCCGRSERCDRPPCSNDGVCKR